MLNKVASAEQSIMIEAKRRAQTVRQAQSRLQHIVADAALEAQKDLLQCKYSEDALKLLDRIPSVAELISIVEDPSGGVTALVDRMRPKFLIGLPTGPIESEEPIASNKRNEYDEVDAREVRVLD
jgi:hypothetical protein